MARCPSCGRLQPSAGALLCVYCAKKLPAAPGLGQLSPTRPILLGPQGRRYLLNQTGETLLGSRGCAVTISDPSVMPQHARILLAQAQAILEDLGGATRVNNILIGGPTVLRDGDTITLGSIDLTYRVGGGSASAAAAPSGTTPHSGNPTASNVVQRPQVSSLQSSSGSALPKSSSFTALSTSGSQLRGYITHMDGPYPEAPDASLGGCVLKVLGVLLMVPLLLWRPLLGSLMFFRRQPKQLPARYLRVRDQAGQEHVVKVKGEIARGMVAQGDELSFWGRWDNGTLVMSRAFNHGTNSAVLLRPVLERTRTRRIALVIVAVAVIVVLYLYVALGGSLLGAR